MSAEAGAELLRGLYVLMKMATLHGEGHPATVRHAEEMARGGEEAWQLQFVRGGLFYGRQLIECDEETYEQGQEVGEALGRLGFEELSHQGKMEVSALCAMGGMLSRGMVGGASSLADHKIEGFAWREIEQTSWGEAQERVTPEVVSVSNVSLALSSVEMMEANPWSFRDGIGLVRRAQRAWEADAEAAWEALELAEARWTPRRRAWSAALGAWSLLARAGVGEGVCRVGAHAALALGVCGYEERGGVELEVARARAVEAMASQLEGQSGYLPPHVLRVMALLSGLRRRGVGEVVELVWEMGRARSPQGVGFDLTRADLMARLAGQMGTMWSPGWVRIAVAEHGALPAGAHVRLGDGRLGVIVGRVGGRVQVVVEGCLEVVDGRLELVSARRAAGG
jgi:hypothetical protein